MNLKELVLQNLKLTLLNDPDSEGAHCFIVGGIAECVGNLGLSIGEERSRGMCLGCIKGSRVVRHCWLGPRYRGAGAQEWHKSSDIVRADYHDRWQGITLKRRIRRRLAVL